MLFTPLPLSQTVTPFRTPSPLERDVLYGRPLNGNEILLCAKHLNEYCNMSMNCECVYQTLQYSIF